MIGILKIDDREYPDVLRQIKNPPDLLYYIGDISLLKNHKIAIVGSRNSGAYGKWAAYNMAAGLSRADITIVSGMASGIDSAAHDGGLKHNGSTVAVLGCGIDICYPKSAVSLHRRIMESGLVLSEYGPGMEARKYTFPMRNRIISGMCSATIVVEAGIKSGSLITAECAAEQGRDVYAVPGNIDRKQSAGCNKLIRDGARIITGMNDVLEDLGLGSKKGITNSDRSFLAQLGADEKLIYEAVYNDGESSLDDIARMTGKNISEVAGIVSVMEMKGYLHFYYGKVFIEK